MDSNNYVAPTGRGTFTVVVNGQPVGEFNSQNEAENAYNANQGGGSPPGTTIVGGANPPVAGAAPGTYRTPNGDKTIAQMRAELAAAGYNGPQDDYSIQQAYMSTTGGGGGGGGGYGGGGGDTGFNQGAANVALQLAQAAAQQAYLNKRLEMVEIPQMQQLDEREKQRIALEAARDAFNQQYQQGQLTGFVQSGPGQGAAARAQAAFTALPPEQRTAERAAQIWQQIVPGLNPQEAAQLAQAGHDYYAATGQVVPDDVAQQQIARVTGGRLTGQTPTLAREQMNNQTALGFAQLRAQLRGPGDWAQYAQSLASTPPEIRAVIDRAAGQFGYNPAGGGPAAGQAGPGMTVGDPRMAGGPMTTQPSTFYQGQGQVGPGQGATMQLFGQPGAGQVGPGQMNLMRTAQAGTAPVPGGGLGAAYRAQAGPPSTTGGLEQMPTYGAPTATQPSRFFPGPGQTGPGAALPLANQLPRSFASASPDVQDVILSPYEASGQSKRQVLYDFERSLPRYGGPTRGVQRY